MTKSGIPNVWNFREKVIFGIPLSRIAYSIPKSSLFHIMSTKTIKAGGELRIIYQEDSPFTINVHLLFFGLNSSLITANVKSMAATY